MLLVSPVSVHSVDGQLCWKPPAVAFTRYEVIAAPLSDGGCHCSTTVRLPTLTTDGVEGVSGLPCTVKLIWPVACRDGSPVASRMT